LKRMDAVKSVYSNYVNFQGRARRSEYWWWYLFYIVVYIVVLMVDQTIFGQPSILTGLFVLANIIPAIAVGVRRLHDTGRSGWWLLIGLIPLVGAIVLIVFFVMAQHPAEKARRIDEILRVDGAVARDVHADIGPAMAGFQLAYGEIVEHGPVHQHVLAINDGGQQTGNGQRGAQRVAQAPPAMHPHRSVGDVGGHAEERAFQVCNIDIAEMLGEAALHLLAAHQADHGQGPVAKRAGFHERLADTGVDFFIAPAHARRSGVVDHYAANDDHALQTARRIVAGLNTVKRVDMDLAEPEAPALDPATLNGVIPSDVRTPYDVREVIARIVDGSRFDEFKALYGETLVCGFARLHGMPVGIIANNGVIFSESALKGAHFIELCCQRGIPLLFLQNITGFMAATAMRPSSALSTQ